jgi:hypothetical protein
MGAVDNRAKSKFRMTRCADLPHKKQIEWRFKRFGDFKRDRHTAARERKNDRIS